jgi:hypothetical protein
MSFKVIANKQNHLIFQTGTGRCLGGLAISHYRPWVFPLYTPSGVTVLQEAPPDHHFHNGLFVGQYPVVAGDREVNFWAVPPERVANDPLIRDVGRMAVEQTPSTFDDEAGFGFRLHVVWRDADEEPVLDEVRTVRFHVSDGATLCDMESRKTAAYGPVRFPPTKHGSIGMRVEPRLLPDFGAQVIGDGGRRGRADAVHEKDSAYVAYENDLAGHGRFGVLMAPLAGSAEGVWFVRDYGMAMYDATLHTETALEQGQSWTVGLRVAAYDGALTDDLARHWIAP